jgi:GntR family transcriptional regulator
MLFRIRAESGEPIYEQLVRQVKHAIMTGALKTGEQLPTVRELAAQLVINPNTVARAYRELERSGLLESTTGRGTFVKFTPPKLFREERRRRLQPFLDQLLAEATALNFSTEELKDQLEETIKKFKQSPV